MAAHCIILAWRIIWTEETVGLQSIASQTVRHDRATNTLCIYIHIFFSSFNDGGSVSLPMKG